MVPGRHPERWKQWFLWSANLSVVNWLLQVGGGGLEGPLLVVTATVIMRSYWLLNLLRRYVFSWIHHIGVCRGNTDLDAGFPGACVGYSVMTNLLIY